MEINDILSKLGIDLSNPEARRGAIEAIDAILASREPTPTGGSGGGGGMGGGSKEKEIELDPDLIQPSAKQNEPDFSDDDIEIEDEEDILSQIKRKDPEDHIENPSSPEKDSKKGDGNKDKSGESDKSNEPVNKDDDENKTTDYDDKDDANKPEDDENKMVDYDNDDSDTPGDKDDDTEVVPPDNDFDGEDGETGSDFDDGESEDDFDDSDDSDDDYDDFGGEGGGDGDGESESDRDFDDPDDAEPGEGDHEEDEFDFDEDDLVDDELNKQAEDDEIKTKHNARKIKRDRTLAAAKTALAKAQANRVSQALIRELERSIEALESLVEAATKNLKDISDSEFNMMINRVLDAIEACGNSGLTYSSEEERQAKIKEIKTDLSSDQTRAELSAEDAAKIRSETQAVQAREKETDRYKQRDSNSFKGFQEFLNSLYKAIKLQVSTEDERDDTWSAISRRNSGAGVLRQGQKINDLPNKKIPIIDFYFDTSTSWKDSDIQVGMKAVSQLADMEEKGQIKLNIFYFADEVSTTPTRGTTSGWNEIVKNVIATQATNVVVMTDSDMENWWTGPKPLSYTVPGYVWYLWKNGSNAQRLPRDLKGRGGVQQFSFNKGDV